MTDYQTDIARAADLHLSPAQLRQAQQEMWARHCVAAWQGAPVAALSGAMIRPDRARRVERVL